MTTTRLVMRREARSEMKLAIVSDQDGNSWMVRYCSILKNFRTLQ
jgi:hypothetical protein